MLRTLTLVIALAAPAAAMAQTTPASPPQDYSIQMAIAQNLAEMRRQNYVPIRTRVYQESLTRLTRFNLSPARVDRADRVSLLIDNGDCPGAIALARAENDRPMVRQARALCRSRERNAAR